MRRDARPGRWRRVAGGVALAGASCLLAAGGGEILVRVLAPQQLILTRPDMWQPADIVGWTHRPGLDTSINTGERTVRYLTDQNGFRVGRSPRSSGQRRILLLGDSFMDAMQVEYEQSTAGLLETNLMIRLAAPIAIHNAAVAGWDPPQYRSQAEAAFRRERFELVLVTLYVGNDVVLRDRGPLPPRAPVEEHAFSLPRRFTKADFIEAVAYPLNDYLEVRSHLFVFLKQRGEQGLMRLGLTAAYFPQELMRAEAESPRWAVTAAICREIADIANRSGAKAMFVLLPTPVQVDRQALRTYVRGFGIDAARVDLEQPNRLLTQELRRQGLSVLDALQPFRDAHDRGLRLYGRVDPHLTPEGHMALEELLEPVVASYVAAQPSVASQAARHAAP